MKPIISLLALTLCVAACSGDSQGPTSEDLRVQDSVLAHDVMAAWGDSFRVKVEEPSYVDFGDVKSGASKAEIAKAPARTTQTTSTVPLAPILTGPQDLAVVTAKPEKPREEKAAAPRVRTIPKGSSLSLVTNSRVCTSRIGETFAAVLVAPVSTSGGTIPSGSRAIAEITANDQWGAGIGVRVRSIHTDGTSYPVTSRVIYIVPENSAGSTCIPRRAHIDTEVRG